MALRNQPYFPLYVQDFLTDEKLMECSAATTGVYIRLLCVMHKSKEYGTVLLKQKDKQTSKQINNFAYKLVKYMPYKKQTIIDALSELINEEVIFIDEDRLIQNRMIKDNNISIIRSKSGSIGGKKTQKLAKAKIEASTENEIETVIEYDNVIKNIVSEFYEFQSAKHKNQLNGWEKDEKLLDDSYAVIDKLHRLDKFSYEDIMLVLRNATKDDFWSDKIISLRGLRNRGKNGQMKFQNAAVKLLKKDAFDEWEEKYGKV